MNEQIQSKIILNEFISINSSKLICQIDAEYNNRLYFLHHNLIGMMDLIAQVTRTTKIIWDKSIFYIDK